MHKALFPTKYIRVSSSVILVRKSATPTMGQDYQILLLKRNPGISFGGLYAFPGGMVEQQDHVEPWRDQMPHFFAETGKKHQDFTKRVCVLRELFEETNYLFATKNGNEAKEVDSLENYKGTHKEDFLKFSKACGINPDLDNLRGFQRVASPIGFHPTNDTQFYLYFMDEKKQQERPMILNHEEFTEHKWLSPDEALQMYSDKQIPLFPPQLFLITFLKFLSNSYNHLKDEVAAKLQQSQLSYVSNKMLFFNLAKLAKESGTEADPEGKNLKRVLS